MVHLAIAETLKRLPHFRTLSDDVIAQVSACCRLRSYQAAETVFMEGQAAKSFFVVRAGGVRLYRLSATGREQVLNNLRPGQSFAEAALFNFGFFPASCAATGSPTELVEVLGQPFMELFKTDETIAAAMVGSLCQRLSVLIERLDELSTVSAGARLARHLLKLPIEGTTPPLELKLPLAKKDLAAHLSITPETLSRLFGRWRDRGLMETAGSTLRIFDVNTLEAIADGDGA
ncbi:MAG: Crp/Fnr family transcriptional regulator [Planctomycetota bacterium]|jgi:CRP/FNR family transcriptional regulator|nr:Crp/Fnr family transcriptional regulator [Planctomycetota bacterium]MDP6521006.1 Crp/Fnr family transcriptional regulator [Planctomycetota bacterium]MDP6838607.1 Crp/Fnr family transcriptional regulator [Planctomycetota bacterium]MDP6956473.1 Crp/Fnr family transcriptional regulator [Planctomycetota bacterium]